MSATTDFIYEYKLENGTVLNLSNVEEDVYVDIYVPIKNLEVVKFDLTKQFAEQGYDIYDKNRQIDKKIYILIMLLFVKAIVNIME